MQSRKNCQYWHAKRRCLERYGFELTRANYQQMVAMVQNGQGVCVKEDGQRISVWLIRFKSQELKVVYDQKKRSIATFLPHQV